ncbi:MaoC family dehydratase [Pseudahrensia aquimaris]|uniref:MaoC family dehydratase n=1 Tax=Pseudahrensia aquimaris TaxID=744461 RepID=A0ABW3FF78_9HYPH
MLTYDNLAIGQEFALGPKLVTAEEIIEFASEFDPQPFHLDPESDQAAQVGGLIASGWHTCSMFMRMMCDGFILDSTSQGSAGLDEVRWLLPVRPGDRLTGTARVVEKRVPKSRPDLGMVQFEYTLNNQNGETVMTIKGNGMLGRTPEAASA